MARIRTEERRATALELHPLSRSSWSLSIAPSTRCKSNQENKLNGSFLAPSCSSETKGIYKFPAPCMAQSPDERSKHHSFPNDDGKYHNFRSKSTASKASRWQRHKLRPTREETKGGAIGLNWIPPSGAIFQLCPCSTVPIAQAKVCARSSRASSQTESLAFTRRAGSGAT